tara:strand:+ start:4038 stop:4457 length:420 start_codon:yes stop_codon:yes gene_type:complete
MNIRQAKKTDLHNILKFMGLKQVSRKDWHVPSKQFVLSYITNKHNFFIISLEDHKVVGTINGELWNDKGFAYIGEVIAKGKNKQKIIDAMYLYFVNFCKKKGVTLINTYVKKSKEKQIKTYKDLGMKKRGEYFSYEKRI